MIVALAAIPVTLFAGAAIDLAMMATIKQRIRYAADAASLAAVRVPPSLGPAEREAEAKAMFYANLGQPIDGLTITTSVTSTSFSYRVDYTYKTAFLALAGISSQSMSVEVLAEAAAADLDVVLVLDNSLSMKFDKRIEELRKAASGFVTALATIKNAKIQVAVIPFDEMVALSAGTINASTSISADMKFTTPANGEAGQVTDAPKDKTETGAVAKGTWTGCIVDRPAPFDANGTQPRLQNAATLYPRAECKGDKLKPVRGLSNDLVGAQTLITSLQPNRLTNNTIGLQWGLEAFSPSAPLTGANVGSRRIMILMTDGKNTDSRHTGSNKTIDLRMQAACNAVKMEKIELFTINLMEGDREQLRICATDNDHFYHVDEASNLTPVFDEIMKRVSAVRLTK